MMTDCDCHSVAMTWDPLQARIVAADLNDVGRSIKQATITGAMHIFVACPLRMWLFRSFRTVQLSGRSPSARSDAC